MSVIDNKTNSILDAYAGYMGGTVSITFQDYLAARDFAIKEMAVITRSGNEERVIDKKDDNLQSNSITNVNVNPITEPVMLPQSNENKTDSTQPKTKRKRSVTKANEKNDVIEKEDVETAEENEDNDFSILKNIKDTWN